MNVLRQRGNRGGEMEGGREKDKAEGFDRATLFYRASLYLSG